MKGAALIKAMLGADVESHQRRRNSAEGVLLPWQMSSILETKGQATVDGK